MEDLSVNGWANKRDQTTKENKKRNSVLKILLECSQFDALYKYMQSTHCTHMCKLYATSEERRTSVRLTYFSLNLENNCIWPLSIFQFLNIFLIQIIVFLAFFFQLNFGIISFFSFIKTSSALN